MPTFTHSTALSLEKKDKPSWADKNAYLSVLCNDEEIGTISLVSIATMKDCKIKRTNVAMFEINFDKLIPLSSRTNKYQPLPLTPLVEKDLSLLVDESVEWKAIENAIISKVNSIEFIEEYKGNQVPEGKKSITLHLKFGNKNETMTSDEIDDKMNTIIKTLDKKCGAKLREE